MNFIHIAASQWKHQYKFFDLNQSGLGIQSSFFYLEYRNLEYIIYYDLYNKKLIG